MLNLLLFFFGITCIFLIARYNGSNKLFWILLISIMGGFIGGTVVANLSNNEQVNVSTFSTDDNPQTIGYCDLIDHNITEVKFNEPWTMNDQYENVNTINFNTVLSKSCSFEPRQKPDYIDTS